MTKIYLGVDWGRRRVGVAVSDELGRMAHPLSTLEPKSLTGLVQTLAALAKDGAPLVWCWVCPNT